MTGLAGTRFIRVSMPPSLMLGGRDETQVDRVHLGNLGLDCTVSAFGVWGIPLLEEEELLDPLLVKANTLARDIVFLFGMFDTTKCDYVVKVRLSPPVEQLWRRYYPNLRLRNRLTDLTSGPDVIDFGLIGYNALVFLTKALRRQGRLVLRQSRTIV